MSVKPVNPNQKLIGLTGGIASGKSTALEYFASKGIVTIDCDAIVKDLWKNSEQMISDVEHAFGFSIRTKADKKKLSDLIFSNEEKRLLLNQKVHPYVFTEIEYQKHHHWDAPIIVIDMPLLIEVSYQKHVDQIVLVYMTKEAQLERIMKRDNLSLHDAILRLKSQMPLDEKKAYADHVLDNNGTKDALYLQIDQLLKEWRYEK